MLRFWGFCSRGCWTLKFLLPSRVPDKALGSSKNRARAWTRIYSWQAEPSSILNTHHKLEFVKILNKWAWATNQALDSSKNRARAWTRIYSWQAKPSSILNTHHKLELYTCIPSWLPSRLTSNYNSWDKVSGDICLSDPASASAHML
jgi:hypothetical protein